MQTYLKMSEMIVMIVDDTAMMREMHKKYLLELGFTLPNMHFCENGKVGIVTLDRLIKEKKRPALILSDWDMPHMSGLEFIKKLRSLSITKDILFVMVTGHSKQDEYKLALDAGVDCIVKKPFKREVYKENIMGKLHERFPENSQGQNSAA